MPRTLTTNFFMEQPHIRDGNNLYDKSLIDKGIQDISSEVGELLSWSEVEQKSAMNGVQILSWLGF